MKNPFVLDSLEYKRDLKIIYTYIEDTATYLHQMTGKPIEECSEFVKQSLRKGGEHEFRDPVCTYTERNEHGDKELKEGTLLSYVNSAIKNRELIAPTLTTYLNPLQKKSLLVDFIDGNVSARGVAKKAMFHAKKAGDNLTYEIKKLEQTNKKLNNNSISGAHVSASTPLYNKTCHSTLTSNCRSTSGYGNANNEKFLCGNRHYWSPDIVRNNIISIINHSDYVHIDAAMRQYGIKHPTVRETLECIKYSSDLYWKAKHDWKRIEALVATLSDIQRSAFVYTGDLYHLMKCNESVVRLFISKLSMRCTDLHPDPDKPINNSIDDVLTLASAIHVDDIKKYIDIKNESKQPGEKDITGAVGKDLKGTSAYARYASTVENINNVVQEYSDLIKAFWVTPNVPASVAYFPDSIRRSAITSDTDSTIFTVQDWVRWYKGDISFDAESTAVASSMVFLAAQTIIHVLARMSANFGIEEKRLFQIAMKNEYYFPIFVPTGVAKHYYALIAFQEGNIYKDFGKEIKGVHLKSSNAPKIVMDETRKLMDHVMLSIIDGKKISITYVLKWVADIERNIINNIKAGHHDYFRRAQIKTSDSYKRKEESPYMHYLMWQEVFAPKYGEAQPPPYTGLKISCELNTPSKVNDWLLTVKDKELVSRVLNWLEKRNRNQLGSVIVIPEQIIMSNGIPEELLDVIGIRRIVADSCNSLYLVLETLGYYFLNSKLTRLVSDHY